MDDATAPTEVPLAEAAFRLGVAYNVLYRRMFAGEINGRRVGLRWFVQLRDVERLQRERPRTDDRRPAA
jgi:hypothetical protein